MGSDSTIGWTFIQRIRKHDAEAPLSTAVAGEEPIFLNFHDNMLHFWMCPQTKNEFHPRRDLNATVFIRPIAKSKKSPGERGLVQ